MTLKLNDDKTEVLFIASPFFQKQIDCNVFMVDKTAVKPSRSARNIGVIFDNTLDMSDHITQICRISNYHLRNIGSIRKFITTDACSKLMHAFVTSRIDYCNSLLYGLPSNQISRLQRVLNTAAHIVSLTKKYEHISPVLLSLHWLPVEQRIKYKVLLFIFYAVHNTAPSYLSDIITIYQPKRTLRSSNKMLLAIPKSCTSYGDRAFTVCGPTLWNGLPESIRDSHSLENFKSKVKTFLFKEAYGV